MKTLFDRTDDEPLSVSQLTQAIKSSLEEEFTSVWVVGEASNVSRPQSGHIYFQLKDAGASLPAVMWRSVAIRTKFDLKDGMQVILRGRLTLYPPQGKYQLDVEKIEPKGIGAQELALRQLKEKLLAKGYFDPARKRKLPVFPKRIALVTSATGAAVRDLMQVLTTRWPSVEIVLHPVRVQGDGSAQEIAAAIAVLNRFHLECGLLLDLMIVGRGGGSVEDLWAFNEEIVAEAIVRSKVPVVSAVGHESDISISDLVADVHALTPTDAANRVVPDRSEFALMLRDWRNRMEEALQRRIEQARQKLDALRTRSVFQRPLARVREREERLDELSIRLNRSIKQKMIRSRDALTALAGRLESLSPLNVLARGYSLTRTEHNAELVRDAATLQPGDRIVTTLARGTVVSTVEEIEPLTTK